MAKHIGIRRETKSKWERRAPLTPDHVRRLTAAGLEVTVQPSAHRIFSDRDYAEAGARLQDDLSACDTVFAVKEIPLEEIQPDKTYVFFSHTIKGQTHNMPLLQRLMDLNCRLIDYERVTDDTGKRLIFFGRHAGYAGMIDSLSLLGKRWQWEGIPNPFSEVEMAHAYPSLEAAKRQLELIGDRIRQFGLPEPLVIGIAGDGNVSRGVQDILEALGSSRLEPEQLLHQQHFAGDRVHHVVFQERHLVAKREPNAEAFDLDDYYANPEGYVGCFDRYLPKLTVVMNGLYWDTRYPRLVTRHALQQLWQQRPPLKVIGDLGCDIGGAVEVTLKATNQESPSFVYLPAADSISDGIEGHGPVVLAVDNLPCELPREASQTFGDALMPFVEQISGAPVHDSSHLSPPIARAVITQAGRLTPDYAYLSNFLPTGVLS